MTNVIKFEKKEKGHFCPHCKSTDLLNIRDFPKAPGVVVIYTCKDCHYLFGLGDAEVICK